MIEINKVDTQSLSDAQRQDSMLFLCDESNITCKNLRDIEAVIKSAGMPVVLAMPDTEYIVGKRGTAKVQILAAVSPEITNVIPLSYEDAIGELNKPWRRIFSAGTLSWVATDSLKPTLDPNERINIVGTVDEFDREMLRRAFKTVEGSNCWYDPAGSVFVKDGEVLVEASSTSFNNSHCTDIPVHFNEIGLEPGERPVFCDSLHSERVGITIAAQMGVQLENSTIYVTKFPCRSCLQELLSAGIKTIVFGKDSYGLIETADLLKDNRVELKRVVG